MRKRIIIAYLSVLCLLVAHYSIDPTRWHTDSRLQPTGLHSAHDNMLSSLNVTSIAQDRQGLVWIGTSAGINVFDGQGYTQFFHASADTTALPDDYITGLQTDDKGRMWVDTQNGMAVYIGAGRFRRVNDKARAPFRHQAQQSAIPDTPYSLRKPQDMVSCSFRDRTGNVWVGFRNAGYQMVSPERTEFKRANDNPLAKSTAGKDITSLERVGQNILAGTTLRLYIYDKKSGQLTERFYTQMFDSTNNAKRELNNIVALDRNHAWLVGNRQVLSCRIADGTVAIDSKTTNPGSPDMTLGCGTRAGRHLFVASAKFLLKMGYGTTEPQRIKVGNPLFDEETQLACLHDGRVLLFMKNMGLALLSPYGNTIEPLRVSGTPSCGNTDPAFAREDSYGNVWLGTKRSGLYRLDMRRKTVEHMSFVGDVHIQGLVEDTNRRIWITTLKDVVCYNPRTGESAMATLLSSSLNDWNRQYFDNSLCMGPDSTVVLGSSDGCIFAEAATASHAPSRRLLVYALNVTRQDATRLTLNDTIADGSRMALAHDENTLSIKYFCPDLGQTSALMFRYRLDGYDRQWHSPTSSHEAQYSNLPPGKYVFRLQLSASPGMAPASEQSVEITIKPAWWASAAAWWLYCGCAALIIYVLNTLYLRLRTNRMRLVQEQHEREREQHTNEMNMSFFANISHEFRNPITVMAGPLLMLQGDKSLPRHVHQTLRRVCMSVNRMLRLIDQMLDFNQLETDALRLKVGRADASRLLMQLVAAFEESARVRGITVAANIAHADYDVMLDTDKFEKIISNLFTNALKHTPDGGTITFSADMTSADNGRTLTVAVLNSGSHIPEERMADVFKRYYQLADTTGSHHYGWGSGIGLYYVHRLVTLHHGRIKAKNTENGVEFRFCLPSDENAYKLSEKDGESKKVMQIPISNAEETPGDDTDAGTSLEPKDRKKILVVDDDTDVATYISSLFEPHYEVVNRYSAEDALRDIGSLCPDIVLSDVIMGRMSGYELCRRLKSDLMLSHIPVVLITAKSNMDEQINGLRLGAVAYVTKPFDPTYLQAIVAAQLRNMQSLRRQLGESLTTEDVAVAETTMSEQDRRFMDELYALMKRRSAELELNVSTVCRDLLISQSKFNYKLKQLTGDTPGTFFRKYKLNHAAQLLHEGRHTVAEVATLTGFGTAAHFAVAFKKQFGVTPSEFH